MFFIIKWFLKNIVILKKYWCHLVVRVDVATVSLISKSTIRSRANSIAFKLLTHEPCSFQNLPYNWSWNQQSFVVSRWIMVACLWLWWSAHIQLLSFESTINRGEQMNNSLPAYDCGDQPLYSNWAYCRINANRGEQMNYSLPAYGCGHQSLEFSIISTLTVVSRWTMVCLPMVVVISRPLRVRGTSVFTSRIVLHNSFL